MACNPFRIAYLGTDGSNVCKTEDFQEFYLTSTTFAIDVRIFSGPPCEGDITKPKVGYYVYDDGTTRTFGYADENDEGVFVTFVGVCENCTYGYIVNKNEDYFYTDCCGNFVQGVTNGADFQIIYDSSLSHSSNIILLQTTSPIATVCPSPTQTQTPTITPTLTPTPSVTPTHTPTQTLTHTPSITPSNSPVTTESNECDFYVNFPMGIECETIQQPLSQSSNDGKLRINVTGGTSPYRIYWSTGNRLELLENIPAGDYRVTVTDYYGDYSATTICKLIAPKLLCELKGSVEQIFEDNLCINLFNTGYGTYSCQLNYSGFYNTKPYYRILADDCATELSFWIWWSPTNGRWELTQNLGDLTTEYAYNNNPGFQPTTEGAYSWTSLIATIIINKTVIGQGCS